MNVDLKWAGCKQHEHRLVVAYKPPVRSAFKHRIPGVEGWPRTKPVALILDQTLRVLVSLRGFKTQPVFRQCCAAIIPFVQGVLLTGRRTNLLGHNTETAVKIPATASRQQCHHRIRPGRERMEGKGWSWAQATLWHIPIKNIFPSPPCLNELLMDRFWQIQALFTGGSPAGGRSASGCRYVCGWPGPGPEAVR